MKTQSQYSRLFHSVSDFGLEYAPRTTNFHEHAEDQSRRFSVRRGARHHYTSFVWLVALTVAICNPQRLFSAAETVVTGFPASIPSAEEIVGYDLFESGLYWWQQRFALITGPCSVVGLKSPRNPSDPSVKIVSDCFHWIGGAVRDPNFVYYSALDQGSNNYAEVYRKGVSAPPADPAERIVQFLVESNTAVGPITLWDDRLYWSDSIASGFKVWRARTDGTGRELFHSELNGGSVAKLQGYAYRTGPTSFADALFVLARNGDLYRKDIPAGSPVLVATDVTDFALREESVELGTFGLRQYTAMYYGTGNSVSLSPPGSLIKMEMPAGTRATVYTAPQRDQGFIHTLNQIVSVAADERNLYWTERPVVCSTSPSVSCDKHDWDLSIYRRFDPADHTSPAGSPTLMANTPDNAGVNLRSDGSFLYFQLANRIKRLSREATPNPWVAFNGLGHSTLGNATIQFDARGGALTVSGLGASGNDGVRIYTGGGGGATTKLGVFNPDVLPIDAFLNWAAIDPTDMKLQEVTVKRVAGGGAIFADFTGLGVPAVTVALYNNDELVASARGVPPTTPLVTFSGGGAAGGNGGGGLPITIDPCILHPEDCYGIVDIIIWQPDPVGPIGSLVTLPGQLPVRATRVQIQPDPLPVIPSPIQVKEIQITGKNLGRLHIGDQYSVGVHFGEDDPPPPGSALAPTDVAGAVPQVNWNNLNGPLGSASGIVADVNGASVTTSISVEWGSPNTWSSTGRGEENNGFAPGGDRLLMSGYLDTDDGTRVATVLVSGIDPIIANAGYDVLVYILGGVSGRGGAYTIGGVTKYGSAAANPSAHIEDPGVGLADTGTYLRFAGLTGPSFMLVADANNANGPNRNFRAPINGIQIVARSDSPPEGLVYFGLEHHALGQSQYSFEVPGTFTVGNLGSSGNDGVEVNLQQIIRPAAAGSEIVVLGPPRNAYSGDWVALNPHPLPPGGIPDLSIRAVGDWNGRPGTTIGSLRVQSLAVGGMGLVPDFSAVGAGRVRVELWNGCTLVSSFTSANNVSVLTMADAITGTSISADPGDEPCGTGPLPPVPPPWWWSAKWSALVNVATPVGGQFQIDRMRVAPDDMTGTLASLSQISYRASGSFGLRFTGESAGKPIIRCPTNQFVTLPCNSNCVPVSFPLPTVSNGSLVSCTPPSGTCLPAGIHTILCRATNPCSEAECMFTVRVEPELIAPPVIQCPSNFVVGVPCPSNCVPVSYSPPTVSNGALVECLPPSGTCLPAGTHPVLCRATNKCAEAQCTFTVQVVPGPGQPPILQCPGDLVVTLPCTSNCVPVSYSPPTVSNGVLVGCLPPSGTCLPAGTHPVLCRASNDCTQAECTFPVRVDPDLTEPPVVLCPPDIVATTCGAGEVVNYPEPAVTGVAPGDYTLICTPPSGSFFPVGTNKVICCVVDRCGRTTCCEFSVILPKGITFAGNQHCPLGVATLTKDAAGNTLVLGNITETGLDGVQIVLGDANFCEVASPRLASQGDSCRYEFRAVVDGIADRTASILSVACNAAGEMQFTGDMSALGATRYTVLALDGETQVASLSNQPVANVTVGGNAVYVAPSLRWDIKTYKCYIRIKLPKLPGNPGPLIRLAAGLAVNGDNVIILPEDPTRRLGAQNRLLLTAAAVHPEPKLILSEQLGLFGVGHAGLGDATLTANGGTLTVGNLGISGNDGVKVDLEASGDFLASLMPLDVSFAQGPYPHPWIEARAFGHFGGAANHDLGSVRFTGLNPTAVEVEADFTSVGSNTHTIEVWQSGQLVRRIAGHAGIVGTVNGWPSGIGRLGDANSGPIQGIRATFTGGVRVNITGGPMLEGDELRVLVENPSAALGVLQSLHLQSAGFDFFTIVNETRTPALAPRIAQIGPAAGGGFQLTIPTAFGYHYTLESVNVLGGPHPWPWSSLQTFVGDGSVKVFSQPGPVQSSQQFFRVGVEYPVGPAGAGR